MTALEYRQQFAQDWGLSVEQQEELGLYPEPCWCEGDRPGCCGWQMAQSTEGQDGT